MAIRRQLIIRKLHEALRIVREENLFSLVRITFQTIFEDRWLPGRVVELLGNSAHLDGATFLLDSPYITIRLKSRFLIGSYEWEARRLIKKYLPRNLPVIELGASIGIVSCVTNRLLVNPEAHVVVEANPNLVPLLERDEKANDCKFKIIWAALAYGAGQVEFYLDEHFNEGRLGATTGQKIMVPSIRLGAIVDSEGFSTVSLICDIEGEEDELLEMEEEVIRNHVNWLLIEVHGTQSARTLLHIESLGFQRVAQSRHNYVYCNPVLAHQNGQ